MLGAGHSVRRLPGRRSGSPPHQATGPWRECLGSAGRELRRSRWNGPTSTSIAGRACFGSHSPRSLAPDPSLTRFRPDPVLRAAARRGPRRLLVLPSCCQTGCRRREGMASSCSTRSPRATGRVDVIDADPGKERYGRSGGCLHRGTSSIHPPVAAAPFQAAGWGFRQVSKEVHPLGQNAPWFPERACPILRDRERFAMVGEVISIDCEGSLRSCVRPL